MFSDVKIYSDYTIRNIKTRIIKITMKRNIKTVTEVIKKLIICSGAYKRNHHMSTIFLLEKA